MIDKCLHDGGKKQSFFVSVYNIPTLATGSRKHT